MATDTDQALKAPGVILTGASSQIGVFAIPRLVDAGFHVFAISRKGRPETFPSFEQVDWLTEAGTAATQGCHYLISAGPLMLAQKFLATVQDLQTAIVFSSSSVETKHESGDPAERRQMQGMLALEKELELMAQGRGIKLSILRPTLIYGCGLDSNISQLADWISRFGFMPVNGNAAGLRQPVHADDLASAAVTALLSTKGLPHVLSLTGGETLSYSDMVTKIFTALNKPVRLVRLPQWLFMLLVRIAATLKVGDKINAEMVRRQRLDLVFDDRQARELLNYNPRPFTPTGKDFSLPETEQVTRV